MKDIDKDDNPDNMNSEMSNNETTYKSSQEFNFFSNNKNFSVTSPSTFFSPSLNACNFPPPQQNTNLEKMNFFPKNNILSIFNDKNLTKELQKNLSTAQNDYIDKIVNELK